MNMLLFNSLISEGTSKIIIVSKENSKNFTYMDIKNGEINLLNKYKTSKLLTIHRAIIK